MAQSLIKLIPVPSFGDDKQFYGCEINGKRYKVEPRNHLDHRSPDVGIPVRVNGIRHKLYSEYNVHHRAHQIYLYAEIGPYKGYKGPRLIRQHFEVTHKVFAEHFNIVMWKRENGSVWVCRVQTMKAVEEHMTDGWELDIPVDRQTDKKFITVTRDGRGVVELNPHYIKPVEVATP
jgi:hypothetical protein